MASEKQVSLAMQRYAAEVFRIQQDKPQVSLSTLAAQVEPSPQAIARMVRRLTEGGYASYVYKKSGDYLVTLKVTDAQGNSDALRRDITIR